MEAIRTSVVGRFKDEASMDPAALKQVNTFSSRASKEIFVVYLGDIKHNDPELVIASHIEMLTPLFGSKEKAMRSIVCHYKYAFSGFSARLTWSQAERIADMPGVVSVSRNFKLYLQDKSHSLDFFGIGYNSQSKTPFQKGNYGNYGEEKIVGVIDSGTKSDMKNIEGSTDLED